MNNLTSESKNDFQKVSDKVFTEKLSKLKRSSSNTKINKLNEMNDDRAGAGYEARSIQSNRFHQMSERLYLYSKEKHNDISGADESQGKDTAAIHG